MKPEIRLAQWLMASVFLVMGGYRLWQALQGAPGKVLVHCSTGNRAGALMALAAHAQGLPAADALALGKAAGLTGLEPAVRGKLGLPAAACADAPGGRC